MRSKLRLALLALILLSPSLAHAEKFTGTTNPASIISEWYTVGSTITTADNSGSVIVNPSLISGIGTTRYYVSMMGRSTSLQVRMRYKTSGTVTTSPVVQMFGYTENGLYQRLLDATALHQIPLAVDTTNDVRDGTYSYTQPVEVDASACNQVLVTVMTALAGSGITGATIEARVK